MIFPRAPCGERFRGGIRGGSSRVRDIGMGAGEDPGGSSSCVARPQARIFTAYRLEWTSTYHDPSRSSPQKEWRQWQAATCTVTLQR